MPEKLRLLVVDDEHTVAMSIRLAADDSYHVDTAGSGEDALDILSAGRYDAFLLDKNLPGIDGIELLRRIRGIDREAACMVITAFPSARSAAESLTLDIDGYVDKPYDVFELLAKVRSAVEVRQHLRDRSQPGTSAEQHLRAAKDHLRSDALGPDQSNVLVATPKSGTAATVSARLTALGASVEVAASYAGAADVLAHGRAALAFLDAALGWKTIGALVELVEAGSRVDHVVVLADDAPPLGIARRLIELRAALLWRPGDTASMERAVDRIYRKPSGSTARRPEPLP